MDKIMIMTNHSYMLWRFHRELIEALCRKHEVVLCMPFTGHEKDFQRMGLRCWQTEMERRGKNPLQEVRLLGLYRRILEAEQPNLVLTYSVKPNIYGGLLCTRKKIPFCANVQGLGTAFQKKGMALLVTLLYRRAFRKVRTVFFENQENALEFQKRHVLPEKKEKVLSGAGINLEEYPLLPYPQNQTMHFLYLGRIMKEKGIDELFAAVRRLKAENASFVLDLVGFFEEGYEEQVEEMEKEQIVVFHGFQSDPRPFYQHADCVLLPSYHEGMSNVLLEASAMGRPVITSDIPGCREAVESEVSGLLVRAVDAESLYQKMRQMLETPPEKRAAMGKAGHEKMKREFSRTKVVRETLQELGI